MVLLCLARVLAEHDHSVLTKGTSAEIEITLRGDSPSGAGAVPRPIPIEPFAVNKDMGRILLRRGGETIGAGRSLSVKLSLTTTLNHGGRNRVGSSPVKFANDGLNPKRHNIYTVDVFALAVPKT